jgi:hypothetical protein
MDVETLVQTLQDSLLQHNATTEENLENEHKLNKKSTLEKLHYLYKLYNDILYFRLEQARNENKLTEDEFNRLRKQLQKLLADKPNERNVRVALMLFEKNQRLLDNENEWSNAPVIKKAIQETFEGIPPKRDNVKDELTDMYYKVNGRAIDSLHTAYNEGTITKQKRNEEYDFFKQQLSNGQPDCILNPDDCRERIENLGAFYKLNKTRATQPWRQYVTRRRNLPQVTNLRLLIEKLNQAFFHGKHSTQATDKLSIINELFKQAVQQTSSSLDDAKREGYITEDKYNEEKKNISESFDNYECEGNINECSDKIDQLIKFYQHNQRRYRKIWRPLAKRLGFTKGGKRKKSNKQRGCHLTRKRRKN